MVRCADDVKCLLRLRDIGLQYIKHCIIHITTHEYMDSDSVGMRIVWLNSLWNLLFCAHPTCFCHLLHIVNFWWLYLVTILVWSGCLKGKSTNIANCMQGSLYFRHSNNHRSQLYSSTCRSISRSHWLAWRWTAGLIFHYKLYGSVFSSMHWFIHNFTADNSSGGSGCFQRW